VPDVEPAITATDVRKRYGETQALDGVDLRVEHQECVAVLGPNGAGKTTAVEIFEGYRTRDSGAVTVLGVDPATAGQEWRRRIGIVLQSATDLGDLTVAETVHHFATYYPNARNPDEVIDLVGLTAKRDARGRLLSGGQRRRLDVALGIIGRPELLFLDEPTTGFDPEARRDFWALIAELRAAGTTILLTTHYLEEAEALADRVVVIANGQVRAEGPPATLGGRSNGMAEVSWTEGGQVRTEVTEDPTNVVLNLAARFGGPIPELTVRRPTLEDTYLALVGQESEPVS
jgi:ABC-2 type transport system ATP-binding protein